MKSENDELDQLLSKEKQPEIQSDVYQISLSRAKVPDQEGIKKDDPTRKLGFANLKQK